jgi:hypothetical protein
MLRPSRARKLPGCVCVAILFVAAIATEGGAGALPPPGAGFATAICTEPSVAAGNGNLTITVTGSNLVPGAVLLWNGTERTTTFVDSSHLMVSVPASDVSHAGTATLVVNNPGSSNSSSISFTVN